MAPVKPGEGFEGVHRRPERDAEPLLRAKITPPALPGWNVPRPRVDKCVDKGVRQGMITVVSGPAGAGKTTALAAWAVGGDWAGPVAWLTLDEYDNQPEVFWRYLAAALRRAGLPVPPDGTAGGQGSQALPSAGAPLRVASAFAGQQPSAVIVLDNLHVLHEHTVTAGLAHMLQHAGPGLRMLIASRAEPPLPLHRYLLTGDLTEISASQLAFTGPEARLLLSMHEVTAYSESLVSLIRKAEGWAAGLRLAAIALNRSPAERAGSLRSVEGPVTAYLNEEVIDPQPRQVRDFMLRTSVVDSVGPDLAVALTGRERSAAVLAELVRSNLFTEQLADGRYRYHALFADVLRARLGEEHPGLTGELQRKAAIWYHEHGQLADAVRYAARIGDWQLAAGFVIDELAMSRLLDPEHGRELVGSLQAITAGVFPSRPQPPLVAAAVALAGTDHDASALWLSRADEMLRRLSIGQEVPSRYAAAVIRFELARYHGDLDALYSAAAEAETALSRLPADVRARHAELSAWVQASQGTAALWLGRFEVAGQALADAAAMPLPPAAEASRVGWTGHLALAEALRGRLERASELAARAIGAEGEPAGPAPEPPPNAAADVALAWVHLERNELSEARNSLRRAEAGLRMRRDRAVAATASLVAARLHLAEGRHAVALRMLGRARQAWSVPAWLDRRLTLAEARAAAMAGDPGAALAAAGRCGAVDELDVATARAAALMAAGEIKAARGALRCALELAEEDPERIGDPALLDALLLDARIHYAAGDRAAGRQSLARALRIGRSEDVRLPFAMERAWIVPVLRTDADLTAGYQALFQPLHAGNGGDDLQSLLSGLEQSAMVEPLTGREQEVLKRVAQLMSTAEIANELYISVNTVKTHLKSVHRKLAVTHRREAVRRARQLKLI